MPTSTVPAYEPICQRLRPRFGEIDRIVQRAMRRLKRYVGFAARRGDHFRAREKANIFNRLLVNAAKRLWKNDPNVALRPTRGLDLFLVDGEILLWFKKTGSRGITRNHRSRQQTRWRAHQPMLGFPEAARIAVAVVVDPTFTEVEDLRLVCPRGYASNAWSHSIWDEQRGVIVLPLAPAPVPETTIEPKVAIKRKDVAE